MSELFEVSEGDVFRNEDDGIELTIVQVYAERGYVVLADAQREVTVSIESLLDAVKDGEHIRVEEDNEEESPAESDEDEGEAEDDD